MRAKYSGDQDEIKTVLIRSCEKTRKTANRFASLMRGTSFDLPRISVAKRLGWQPPIEAGSQ